MGRSGMGRSMGVRRKSFIATLWQIKTPQWLWTHVTPLFGERHHPLCGNPNPRPPTGEDGLLQCRPRTSPYLYAVGYFDVAEGGLHQIPVDQLGCDQYARVGWCVRETVAQFLRSLVIPNT